MELPTKTGTSMLDLASGFHAAKSVMVQIHSGMKNDFKIVEQIEHVSKAWFTIQRKTTQGLHLCL